MRFPVLLQYRCTVAQHFPPGKDGQRMSTCACCVCVCVFLASNQSSRSKWYRKKSQQVNKTWFEYCKKNEHCNIALFLSRLNYNPTFFSGMDGCIYHFWGSWLGPCWGHNHTVVGHCGNCWAADDSIWKHRAPPVFSNWLSIWGRSANFWKKLLILASNAAPRCSQSFPLLGLLDV